MIEMHLAGSRRGHFCAQHVKVDDAGLRSLIEGSLGPHERLAPLAVIKLTALDLGVEVYLNECPCDERAAL